MLVNDYDTVSFEEIANNYSTAADVHFVSYTGYDPHCNLCHGELVLSINGKICSFGQRLEYQSFFAPISCESNYGWETDVQLLPDELLPFAKRIDEVLNANMPACCCRGCE